MNLIRKQNTWFPSLMDEFINTNSRYSGDYQHQDHEDFELSHTYLPIQNAPEINQMKSYGGPTTLDKILTSEEMINQEKHFETSCSAQLNKIDSVSQNSRGVKISSNENLSL